MNLNFCAYMVGFCRAGHILPNTTVLVQFLRDFIFCKKGLGISRVFMIVRIFRNFSSMTVLMGLHRLFILLSLQLY